MEFKQKELTQTTTSSKLTEVEKYLFAEISSCK